MEGTAEIPTQYRLRVKQRLAVVEYVRQHGIKPASRQFGLARPTVREWWRNWQRAGIKGLVPQYPRGGGAALAMTWWCYSRRRASSSSLVRVARASGCRGSTRSV